ncbi:MAG: glucokinase [Leptolyngbyaceae bacterium]|nr:glucokinase [Leptolyngbyaceae bacterium]
MTVLLAGDIGGTKTILRLADAECGSSVTEMATTTLFEEQYASGEFPDLVPMVQTFLKEAETQTGKAHTPERACFAIAGPVSDNTSSLTNLSWSLEGDRLEKELRLSPVKLINDFAAVGYGVLGLSDDDVCALQSVKAQPNAPIAVIGAGTGLGQGFLIPDRYGRYEVYPSEGGHADFAPRSQLEFELLSYLRDKFKITRISSERVVSGQGIAAIYQFLRDRQSAQETPEVATAIRTWERELGLAEKSIDPAATISIAAAQDTDSLSSRVMSIFVSAYGAEAGNLALKLLPYGGLYVAGGIAAKNLPLMTSGKFMDAFMDKGRVSHLLENVPVNVVLNPKVGLIGATLYAAVMDG